MGLGGLGFVEWFKAIQLIVCYIINPEVLEGVDIVPLVPRSFRPRLVKLFIYNSVIDSSHLPMPNPIGDLIELFLIESG
jgi:hypothetical protein